MDPELQALLAKVRAAIDLRNVPRVLLHDYIDTGGDPQDINRIAQILAANNSEEMLADVNMFGFEGMIKPRIKQRVVDFVDKKFRELLVEPSTSSTEVYGARRRTTDDDTPSGVTGTQLMVGCGVVVAIMLAMVVTVVLAVAATMYMLRQPSPSPYPGPYVPIPTPSPTPTPVPIPANFPRELQEIFQSEGGTGADGRILGAMLLQAVTSLDWNDSQQPKLESVVGFGRSFARMQQHRFAQETTPFATKYSRTEQRIKQEMVSRGIPDKGALTEDIRMKLKVLFQEAGSALASVP